MTVKGGRDRRQLRGRCEALVADLDIPAPFDLAALCASLGSRRGRALRMIAVPRSLATNLPCGMWVRLVDEDIILIDPATSALHQRQIGLHEFAHMLCDHGEWTALGDHDAAALGEFIDPAVATRMVMGRSRYGDQQELEAEMIATLLAERIVLAESVPTLGPNAGDGETHKVLEELRRALGGRAARWDPKP